MLLKPYELAGEIVKKKGSSALSLVHNRTVKVQV
jgi:hypothetical protein